MLFSFFPTIVLFLFSSSLIVNNHYIVNKVSIFVSSCLESLIICQIYMCIMLTLLCFIHYTTIKPQKWPIHFFNIPNTACNFTDHEPAWQIPVFLNGKPIRWEDKNNEQQKKLHFLKPISFFTIFRLFITHKIILKGLKQTNLILGSSRVQSF